MRDGMIDRLRQLINEEEIIELTARLVAIPSYPGVSEQETGVAESIRDYFDSLGIQCEIVPVVNGRCNVIATLKGSGTGPSLLLTGHTDTVPPYDMKGDPFNVSIKDRKLFGRGVVDMKGALACMMTAMKAVKQSGIELKGDIVFAGVIDEEDKSEGTRALLKSGFNADAAIVGEPTELAVCVGHRGLEWFEINFKGKTVHGGKQKEGINAIAKASKFIERIEAELIPELEKRKHPVIGSSSMNYGLIRGGTQPSTVAGECVLQFDRRWVPGEKFEDIVREYKDILEALNREDPQFNADIKVMEASLMEEGFIHEAMEIDPEHPFVKVLEASVMQATGKNPEISSFTAWTDGGLLQSYGNIPTVVLGPGNLESAHSANEHVEISQLISASLIYAAVAAKFCS